MQLHVIAVGRVRDASLRAACDEYLTRTRRYITVDEHEVPAAKARRPADVMKLEGERLLGRMPERARGVALVRTGKGMGSRAFAERLGSWRRDARDVALVIGGADGLDSAVLARCETHLSLSAMTFPHELARLMLYEQLYRPCSLLSGEPYPKGA